MLFPLMCPPACLSPCPLSPDLPGRRPLPPQRGHTAAPEPVPGELLRGVLQATGAAVWGGSGGGERRRGLALAPWALNPSPPVRSPAWPPDLRPRPPTPKKHNADIQLCRTCADSRPFLLRFFSAFGLRPSLRPHARTPRLPFQQYDGSAPHVHLQTQSSNPKKKKPSRRASGQTGDLREAAETTKHPAFTQTLHAARRRNAFRHTWLQGHAHRRRGGIRRPVTNTLAHTGDDDTGNVTIFKKVVKNLHVGLWLCLLYLQVCKEKEKIAHKLSLGNAGYIIFFWYSCFRPPPPCCSSRSLYFCVSVMLTEFADLHKKKNVWKKKKCSVLFSWWIVFMHFIVTLRFSRTFGLDEQTSITLFSSLCLKLSENTSHKADFGEIVRFLGKCTWCSFLSRGRRWNVVPNNYEAILA